MYISSKTQLQRIKNINLFEKSEDEVWGNTIKTTPSMN